MPKIDTVIGNPPYTNGVHLKHLQRAYEIATRAVIFLHPMGWLHAQKPGPNSLHSRAVAIKKLIGKHFVKFVVMNGNKVFNIKYGQVCGLTLIDKAKDYDNVTVDDKTVAVSRIFPDALSINPMYLDPSIFDPLKDILWKYCASYNIEQMINQDKGPYFVNLPLISGHVDEAGVSDTFLKSDFYQLIYETDKIVADGPKPTKQPRWVSFASSKEAQNFIDYLAASKLAKFCLMIVKGQQNLHRGELLYVPAFDFSCPCSDSELYQLLGLSQNQIDHIERITK